MSNQPEKLHWMSDIPELFEEIQQNPGMEGVISTSLRITYSILQEVAARALQLNDHELNKLMLRLSLYSLNDPRSPDFNPKKVLEYLRRKA